MLYIKEEKKLIYTWEDFKTDCNEIQKDFLEGQGFDSVAGIAFGGLPLTTLLKNRMKVPTRIIFASSYTECKQHELKIKFGDLEKLKERVLIVDDIVDTGKTLLTVSSFLVERGIKYSTLTLFMKKNSILKPDYYIHAVESDTWVVFPWE